MTLSDKQREYIRGVGGEEMLKRALNAEKKRDDAKMQKNNPGGIGTAHKISVDAQRLADVFAVADSLKLRRDYIVKFVEFLGVDNAEAGLHILAGEDPANPYKSGKSLLDQMLQSHPAASKNRVFASSLVERIVKG